METNEHEAEGQAYSQWIKINRPRDFYMPTKEKNTIYLQLLDDFEFYPGIIQLIAGYLRCFFTGCKVKIQKVMYLKDMSITPRGKALEEQYPADVIIESLESDLP